jgi:Plasmid replication region DNA-binding N-term
VTEPPPRYGQASRGISAADVERATDALLRLGHRPTIEKVREKLGTGSPNTINPLLDAWWKRLSARLDAGPAALHRLPEPVAHAAEALWMQALDEGRHRATLEQTTTVRLLTADKQTLEVRSHVLSLREGELASRLHDRDQRQAALEAQLQDLTILLRKEQVTRDAQARRIADLEAQLPTASSNTNQPQSSGLRNRRARATRSRPKRTKETSGPQKKTRKKTAGKKARKRATR